MNLRTLLNKSLVLSVFILAGFLLARSFYYGSFMGIVLAIVAIAAWATFLYRLSASQQEEKEEIAENY